MVVVCMCVCAKSLSARLRSPPPPPPSSERTYATVVKAINFNPCLPKLLSVIILQLCTCVLFLNLWGGGAVDIVSPIFKIVGEGHVALSPPPGFAPMHVYVITQYYIFFFVWPLWVFVNSVCHTFFFILIPFFFSKTFHCNHCSIACKWLNFIDSIKHKKKNGLCATRTPDLWFHRAALYQ